MAEGTVAGSLARRERLAQRRKALGLTQEQLAELLDVERTTVTRWERGQAQPQPWLRPRLARVLRVSADRLAELLAPGAAPARAEGGAAGVPRLLPGAAADFTGRAAELAALTGMLDQAGASLPGTVVISAIGGTAGVGKTALALYWAHQVAARFPDGQLHVNLRGFDVRSAGMPNRRTVPADRFRRIQRGCGESAYRPRRLGKHVRRGSARRARRSRQPGRRCASQ